MKNAVGKRLGIFNMQLHATWKKATFILIVFGGILLFQMKKTCEEYCDLAEKGLREVPVYFHDMLSKINWDIGFMVSLMFVLFVLSLIPFWQGNRKGFYTQLRLPICMKEYVIIQWCHCLLWFFFHWVSQLIVLYLLFETYCNCVPEEIRGTSSFIFGIIRYAGTMRWYPLVVFESIIPWVIQLLFLGVTSVYTASCIQTGHKWGMILVIIHVVGTVIIWTNGISIGSLVFWLICSMSITAWMGHLIKNYLTIEKGL